MKIKGRVYRYFKVIRKTYLKISKGHYHKNHYSGIWTKVIIVWGYMSRMIHTLFPQQIS